MIHKPFVTNYIIPIVKSKFKYAKMADKSKVLLEGKTAPFKIDLQGIQTTIKGLVMPNLNYDIVAGMDWFSQVNPRICWKTKTITVKQNRVNFNIFKEPNNLLLRDTVFVQITNKDNSEQFSKNSVLNILKYSECNNTQTMKTYPPKLKHY